MSYEINDNELSSIKIDVWCGYGIILSTAITDVYGHFQPFVCAARFADNGNECSLSETGEDLIDRDELTVLKMAKEYIVNNYKERYLVNSQMSFS